MGVEGKDKAKVLEAGAAALSGQLGRTVQRLRKSYNLSLSELSTPIGRRQVDHFADRAQRDQSDADDDLAARPCARSVDRIGAAGRGGRPLHRALKPRRHADPGVRRRPLPPRGDRLDQDGRLAAMVRLHRRAGRAPGIGGPSARARSNACRCSRASSRSRSAASSRPRMPARRCATAAICRIASATPRRKRRMRRWCASCGRR